MLTALANSASFADQYIAAGAHLMVGSACAQMGLFGEGLRRLDQAIEGPIPAARRAAEFCKGLTLREMGNEPDARKIFERIYSEEPDSRPTTRPCGIPSSGSSLPPRRSSTPAPTSGTRPARRRWRNLEADSLTERGNEILRAAQDELDRQVGLADVKLQVAKLRSAARLAKVARGQGAEHHLAQSASGVHRSARHR